MVITVGQIVLKKDIELAVDAQYGLIATKSGITNRQDAWVIRLII